ncbi:MAG: hypothetical protein ACTSQY_00700 [Candidatus Odinarchaeia archaeon]
MKTKNIIIDAGEYTITDFKDESLKFVCKKTINADWFIFSIYKIIDKKKIDIAYKFIYMSNFKYLFNSLEVN